MLVYRLACLYMGWGVSIGQGVLVYGMEVLVNRMGCWYTDWGISRQDGVLVYRIWC